MTPLNAFASLLCFPVLWKRTPPAMELRKSVFLNSALFFGIAVVAVVAIGLELRPVVILTKPLLLILLSVWFFFSSRRYGDRFTIMIQTGLLFSFFGDVALLFSQQNEFNYLLGLGSFLIALFAYTLAFLQNIIEMKSNKGILLSSIFTLFVLAFAALIMRTLHPHLHEMYLPVAGYFIALTAMGCAAAFRFKRTYKRSFWMVFIGALFFLLSNALLAFNKFVEPVQGVLISMTAIYILAQYLIVRGSLIHVQRPNKRRG